MQVVAADGLTLDEQKYEQYGPPHMSAFYAVLHSGLIFASIGATVTHVILWHGKVIYRQFMTPGLTPNLRKLPISCTPISSIVSWHVVNKC